MIRFPFKIVITKAGEAELDESGNFVASPPVTLLESECNRVQGKVEERQTASGEVYVPTCKVILPSHTSDAQLLSSLGCQAVITNASGVVVHTGVVKDYYVSGQTFESRSLWL